MISSLLLTTGEEGAKHEKVGAEFIMHHITDSNTLELPLLGEIHLPQIHVMGYDISITKHVVMMWFASLILIAIFGVAFRRPQMVPRGLANFFEFLISYIEEDILKPYLGKQSRKYAPYLLTAFFFILTCNLLGLVPMGATATGNISVTASLAILTFIMVQIAGIRSHGLFGYLKGFIPPDLPLFILPLMIPVEIIGLLTKHVALAIRLFANMIAGHVVIFALMSLIFTFRNWIIGGVTLGGILFVSLLEVLIALIQAYIFTILSAVFISMAIYQEH